MTRLYSVAESEFCKVDVDTLLYQWDFSRFASVERHVQFREDCRKWADRGEAQDQKIQKMSNSMKGS